MHRYALAGALVLGLAFVGCDKVTDDQEVFQSTLLGSNENPARATGATGTAQYVVVDNNTIHYTVEVNNFTNTITLGHIHTGAAGVNGGVIVSLIDVNGVAAPVPNFRTINGNGILVEGTITRSTPLALGFTFDSLLAAMRTQTVYTNFHSNVFGGGEIRGQVVPVTID